MNAPTHPPEFHQVITLGDGPCHYRLCGPERGPVLLMIHGATVPGLEFDRLAPLLQRAGFRTLIPDLYGHGFSARPRVRYDYDLFTRQMTELLEALSIEHPVDVFGHSMGAVVGYGDMLFANDNDGVDDSSGETQLIRVKAVFDDEDD